MSAKKYRVKLSQEQRQKLEELTRRGRVSVREYKRARVLLLADENSERGGKKDAAEMFGETGTPTVQSEIQPGGPAGAEGDAAPKAGNPWD